MREIAVRLPADSRLPLDLAEAARVLDLYTGPGSRYPGMGVRTAVGYCGALERAIETYMPMAEET